MFSNEIVLTRDFICLVGGIYAFARVTLNPFVAYIIGCCELFSYLTMSVTCYLVFGLVLTEAFGSSPYFMSLYWLILFIIGVYFPLLRRFSTFWSQTALFAAASLLLILLFIVCTAQNLDTKYAVADSTPLFKNGIIGFHGALAYVYNMFWGVEVATLMVDYYPNVSLFRSL